MRWEDVMARSLGADVEFVPAFPFVEDSRMMESLGSDLRFEFESTVIFWFGGASIIVGTAAPD